MCYIVVKSSRSLSDLLIKMRSCLVTNGLSYQHQTWYTYTLSLSNALTQRSKGQSHTVTKIVTTHGRSVFRIIRRSATCGRLPARVCMSIRLCFLVTHGVGKAFSRVCLACARGRLPISVNWTFFASYHDWCTISRYWSKLRCLKGGWSLWTQI